jgi:uncharacterized membrane protein
MTLTFDPIWSWLLTVSVASWLGSFWGLWLQRLLLVSVAAVVFGGLSARKHGFHGTRLVVFSVAAGLTVLLGLSFIPVGPALAVLITCLTIWTYIGVERATPRRIASILALRLGALFIAFLLVLRPALAFEEDNAVPSLLLITVDSSTSMNIQDEIGSQSRWDRAIAILQSDRCTALLKKLRQEKNVHILFYRAGEDIAVFDPNSPGVADGKRTDMGKWLDSLLKKHGREPNLRALVLFSDGADNGNRYSAPDLAMQFGRIHCPIYTFGLGSKKTTHRKEDLAFLEESMTTNPTPVAVKNLLTVRAQLQVNGYQNPDVTFRLFYNDSKTPVAVKQMRLGKPADNNNTYDIEITADAPAVIPPPDGELKVTLKVDPLPNEVSKSNNEISTFVTVIKEGLSVLYVEGSLRWEARFIRDALTGHRNLRLYRAFRTSDEKMTADDPEGYQFNKRHYDVIIIGDVTAKHFSGENKAILAKVKELVSKEGVGLLMLGGEESLGSKSDWNTFGKDIADMLPVTFGGGDEKEEENRTRVRVWPTGDGLAHYILRLDGDPEKNKKIWDDDFDELRGLYSVRKKGDASLLATKKGTEKDDVPVPVLVAGKYGKGRTLVFACDSTWNYWRRLVPRPDDAKIDKFDEEIAVKAHRRFWQQVVVWLARQENMDDAIWVLPDARRVAKGGKLAFSVGLRGKDDKNIKDARYQVVVIGPNGQTEVPVVAEGDQNRGLFWKTDLAGEYRLEVKAFDKKTGRPMAGGKTAKARFLVFEEDLEQRSAAASPEKLKKLAENSDGEHHPQEDEKDPNAKDDVEGAFLKFLEDLRHKPLPSGDAKPKMIPDWKLAPASAGLGDQLVGLWVSGALLCLVLFAGMICLEWYLRRRWGLV